MQVLTIIMGTKSEKKSCLQHITSPSKPESSLSWDARCGKQVVCAKSLQSCPPLCDPMDCSPPGASVHGILQAKKLEWVAMPSSRRSSRPRDRNRVSYTSCIGRQVLYHLVKSEKSSKKQQ